ncbi:alpha/beta hydrolase [Actibacterium atlanticum]|uniref:Alpha/beta hydrolase n=1 Tax=Actibacterium atlanticum TaxID=1461693 RepID=A0A058ZK89_9RHOB|nr:alpha/beta fold hydrolase [Actibacterium atlanticum]KCV82039.1 alpha/beta hydrolase [Actibacterium atlanticum]
MLNTVLIGSATAHPPLLIVHGLFGSARNWGVIAKRMSEDRQVITVDMRNHGESAWSDEHSYSAMAQDLAQVIAANGGRADVVGHSMGGKAAMMLALSAPDMVNRLVVADIAPVTYTHDNVPLVHAMRGIDLSLIERRSDADKQLARSVDDPGIRAFLLQSLDVKERRWRLNLDVLEAQMGNVIGWPEGVSGSYAGAALFLSGANSDYVLPEYRTTIKELFPAAKFAKLPGAGHWLHAEKPREFEAALKAFLPV